MKSKHEIIMAALDIIGFILFNPNRTSPWFDFDIAEVRIRFIGKI